MGLHKVSAGEVGPDGKIRVRCSQCGKRLKMSPSQPGKVYTCPICGNSVVAPLGQVRTGHLEDDSELTERDVKRLGWTPTLTRRERYASMEKMGNYLAREYSENAQMLARALSSESLSVIQANEKIIEGRKELAGKIRKFATTLVGEIEQEAYNLEHHPMRKQQSYTEKAEHKRRELRDLKIYLKLMFNMNFFDEDKKQQRGPKEGQENHLS